MKSPYSIVNFDNLHSINSFRMNVEDYQLISPTLAKVVVSYTGVAPTKDEVRATLAQKFKGLAAPVVASFRVLDTSGATKTLVGFVKACREVRELADLDSDRMVVKASNLLMDKEDQSLWEIKAGSTGQYVVKQGEEDLSALVHMASSHQVGQPTLAMVASIEAATNEFAAYVDKETEEVHHGFVVASDESKLTVVSFDQNESVEVAHEQVIEVRYLDEADLKPLGAAPAAEVAANRAALVEYYKKAYPHSPEYVQRLIDMIDQHSFA